MKTHRCKKLLEYNNKDFRKVFIRYGKEYNFDIPNNRIGWWLNHKAHDTEWDSEYTKKVCMIKYCPFCGEELKSLEGEQT